MENPLSLPETPPFIPFPKLRDVSQKQAKKIVEYYVTAITLDDHLPFDLPEERRFNLAGSKLREVPKIADIIQHLHVIAEGDKATTQLTEKNRIDLDHAQATINQYMGEDACTQKLAEKFYTAILMGVRPEQDFTQPGWNRGRNQKNEL